MAETPDTNDAAGDGGGEDQPAAQPITINAQYIRDLSFEVPTAPGIFQVMQQAQPNIEVNINVDSNKLEENVFEVILSFEAQANVGEDVGFILELEYVGVFTIHVPEEHLRPVVFIECPRLLFPFARNILADVSRDGGFPPLMVGPVDFVAMFQRELESKATDGAAAADAADA